MSASARFYIPGTQCRDADGPRCATDSFALSMSQPAAKPDQERRKNAALRELIDELLFRVRDANQHIDFWTPEERAKAEEELSMIMSRVRGAALHKSS
jgi:hypothetical protein